MLKKTKGVYHLNRKTIVTHYKIKNRDKTRAEGIGNYKTTTQITNPACSQNLRKREVISGKLEGKRVGVNCSDGIVAAHVTIRGMNGIYVIPMCHNHNDSLNPNAAPVEGSTVIIKQKCIAMKVPNDENQRKNQRPFSRNRSKSNNKKNTKQLSKKAMLLRARRNGDTTFPWNGKRLYVADYKVDRSTRRVKKR
jgi:hypothetical protein